MRYTTLLLLFIFFAWQQARAQTIKGRVIDENGEALVGANVSIVGTTKGTLVNTEGFYEINDVPAGSYELIASFIGYKSIKQTAVVSNTESAMLDFRLQSDPLGLDEVIVTGTFDPRSKLESSVAITTLDSKGIQQRNPQSTGDLLQSIPGTFVDASGGVADAKIYPRGLASGTVGNGTGFRYVSLQEDGLPVISTLLGFATPDVFHRPDETVARLEAVRGGSASLAAANSPGGVYNFISKEGKGKPLSGIFKLQGGLQGKDNLLLRLDGNIGGAIGQKGWTYNVGGFYRVDEGARELPYNANEGGQIKFNVVKNHSTGKIKLYGKLLDDRVAVYRNLPVTNLTDPEPWNGFNLNYSSTLTEASNTMPDGEFWRNDNNATRNWDASNRVKAENYVGGLEIIQDFGNWTITNNAKFSYLHNRFNQVNAENLLPMQFVAPATVAPGVNVPVSLTYRDVRTGETLAQTDGSTVASSSIGDYFMLTAALDMRNEINDFMDQLTISRKFEGHALTIGGFLGNAAADIRWDSDLLAQVLEPNPRPLVIQGAVGANTLELSDANGFFSYGSLAYVNFESTVRTLAGFINDVWEVNKQFSIDAGLRYESVNHNGKKESWSVPANGVGADGNPLTRYDRTIRIGTGNFFEFDHTHEYLSYSLGLNYQLNPTHAVYGRFTRGNKAPDVDFYIRNYVNTEILKGLDEKVTQVEAGYKLNSENLSVFFTAFWSQISDLPYTVLITETTTGETFFTPPTFNTSRTMGLEIETFYKPVKDFSIRMIATLQDPRLTRFTFYNTNGASHPVFIGETYPAINPATGEAYMDAAGNDIEAGTPSFHTEESLDGNQVDNIPRIILDITPAYSFKWLSVYLNWRHTGNRSYNKQNALDIPAYQVLNGGVTAAVRNFIFAFRMNNILNSDALIDNGALGLPGSALDGITKENIDTHLALGLPFWGRPLLPRSMRLSVAYSF